MMDINIQLWQEFEQQSAYYRGEIPAKQFDYAINISMRYRYFYYEVPKAACSTIKLSLQRIELDQPNLIRSDFEMIHKRDFSPLLRPAQMGNFHAFMQRQDIFRFCFVRHPYDRLLSAYLDKIARPSRTKLNILHHLGYDEQDMARPISFDEFLQVVAEQDIAAMDPHWRLQYAHTCQDRIEYDFIGRLENFNQDFEYVLRRIKPHDWQAEKRHATDSKRRLDHFYDRQKKALVYEVYRQDFEYFAYKP